MVELNRLFFALWPSEAVRTACADAVKDLKLRMPAAGRWTAPERYHLTLCFLGSAVSADQEAAARAAAAAVRAPPFELTLDHAGCFRRRQSPWWLGARAVPPGLTTLIEGLHRELLAVRVLPDRERFVPHLTLLRDAARPLPETAIRPIAWPLADFVMVRSDVGRASGGYEVIGRWPLAAPSSVQRELWEN